MGAETPQFVGGCNCCGCCCGVIHSQKLSGISEAAQRSNYRAGIDEAKCITCGLCIKRCPVKAIDEVKKDPAVPAENKKRGKARVAREKCIGCGVCVIKCPTNAIAMVPVSKEEWFYTPASMAEWEEQRLKNMAKGK